MIPLIVYFMLVGEWYAYVLALFSTILTWVLLYAAQSTNRLLMQTRHQATHDALSGLFNRQYFIEHLQRRMNSLNENGEHGYLLLIDLDHFKTINDTLGHDVGDRLLQGVVARLRDSVGDHCVVARLGGDEFIITGGSFRQRDACEADALEAAGQVLAALKAPYVVGAHQLHISASIGVSLLGPGDNNANRFIKEADIAMYEVKARGRDGVFVFDEEIARRVEGDLEIERLLHFALSHDEITLHYQPQVDRAGRIIGAEALVRWISPTLGAVPPDRFIPLAEQTGLIIELGRHILETAFRTLGDWSRDGITLQQFSVNISMRQFTHPGFAAQVEELVKRHLDPALIQTLMFEITETVVTEDIDGVIQTMQELKALGIRFSMDDFGTGYSSLSHLNRLPLDELKVDRAFVLALGDDESDRALVVTILNMASLLGLNTVAEGVETAAQHAFLMHHGCGMFQGYFHSKPLAKEAFELFIQDHATARDAI
jgi:diguanylate cyclase (GGDEF)-like protein